MSAEPMSSHLSGIFRHLYRKTGTYCWKVHLQRNGKAFQKRFNDSRHGGEQAALAPACAWRDHIIATHPPIMLGQFCAIVRAGDSSRVPGVSRHIWRKRRKNGSMAEYIYWESKTQLPNGRLHTRKFSVLAYGEEGAKSHAIAARHKILEELKSVVYREQGQPHSQSRGLWKRPRHGVTSCFIRCLP